MNLVILDRTASTNAAVAAMGPEETPHGLVVAARAQTAGRGQRGNKWEAEPGANLTFSMVVRRGFEAPRQFDLSMLVSLGIVAALARRVDPGRLRIKWPNDIYFGDSKLAGILIENTLSGSLIERSIVGIGLNVNQTVFRSPAPNPVSLAQITGHTHELRPLLEEIAGEILDMVDSYCENPEPDELLALYMQRLWRNDGQTHLWIDTRPGDELPAVSVATPFTPSGSAEGTPFFARIAGVGLDGTLRLLPTAPDGAPVPGAQPAAFAFKQVAPLL